MKNFLFLTLCIFLLPTLQAQDLRTQLARGKEQLRLGNYNQAVALFSEIMSAPGTHPYRAYAQFYRGVALIQQGKYVDGRSVLVDLEQAQPGWERRDDLLFWIAKAEFEQEKYPQGIEAANRIRSPQVQADAEKMQKVYFEKIAARQQVEELYRQYPENRALAGRLIAFLAGSNRQEDKVRAEIMRERFGIEQKTVVPVKVEAEKKDVYNVGLMLPQTLHLVTAGGQVRNTIYLDYVSGFKLGVEAAAKRKGVKMNLFTYDTQSPSFTSQEALLGLAEIKGMDVLLYHQNDEGLQKAAAGAAERGALLIAPLSGSEAGLSGKVLFAKPSHEVLARKALSFAAEQLGTKRAVIIYGNSPRDRALAEIYRREAESRGFSVRFMEMVASPENAQIFNQLTATKMEPAPTRTDPNAKMEVPRLTKEELGHVFVASENSSLVASVISAITRRADKLPIIGLDTWLATGIVSPAQAENLGLNLLGFYAVNQAAEQAAIFREDYIQKYQSFPAPYAYLGYDMALLLAEVLGKHGLSAINGIEGLALELMARYHFEAENVNTHVPVFSVVDGKVIQKK